MSETNSNSDFEEFCYSDLESSDDKAGEEESDEESDEESSTNVVVEFPESLQNKEHDTSNDNNSTPSSSYITFRKMESLTLHSFDGESNNKVVVEIPERLQKRGDTLNSDVPTEKMMAFATRSSHDDDTATWSFIEGNGNGSQEEILSTASSCQYYSTDSVAASSTISGFDVLSINGSSQRQCKRCSFLNGESAGICAGCGVALVANPCLDMDAQIAMNLQLKEEEQAGNAIQMEERKRKALAEKPLFVQAQVLANDIVSLVEQHRSRGFACLSEADLTLHASNFIDFFHEASQHEFTTATVSVNYYFSDKTLPQTMEQIRRDGFGSHVIVSQSMEAAWAVHKKVNVERLLPETFLADTEPSPLASIPENGVPDPEETDRVGWLVAAIDGREEENFSENLAEVSKHGWAIVKTLFESKQCLPLVCFDASLRKDATTELLLEGLSLICDDFFFRLASASSAFSSTRQDADYVDDEHSPSKKLRAEVPSEAVQEDLKNLGLENAKAVSECDDKQDGFTETFTKETLSSVENPGSMDNLSSFVTKEGKMTVEKQHDSLTQVDVEECVDESTPTPISTCIGSKLQGPTFSEEVDSQSDNFSANVEGIASLPQAPAITSNLDTTGLSLADLHAQMDAIRLQFKEYNHAFALQFGRPPIYKNEKEPIRHLGARYNSLSNQIALLEKKKE